jgi:hypothetical protein
MAYAKHAKVGPLPEQHLKIWRYMSLAKFIWLLQTQYLYFANAAELAKDDPWEGVYPVDREKRWFLKDMAGPQGNANEEGLKAHLQAMKGLRHDYAVNCWHLSEHESAAMWKLYGQETNCVAIQSTVKRLVESLKENTQKIFIGKVHYIDTVKGERPPTGNVIVPLFYKRMSFAHEAELRAIVSVEEWDTGVDPQGGCQVFARLTDLLETVHISPGAPPWFATMVKMEMVKHKLPDEIPLKGSHMDIEPLY